MKVPVMLGIFEAVSRGELRLDQPVRVRNEFTSILDGSKYALESRGIPTQRCTNRSAVIFHSRSSCDA
jgi:hypothetical protein